MPLRVAVAPTSWGVELPDDPANPPWSRFLDEAATAGYTGVELGPTGYLPEDDERLRRELDERRLELVAGYVFEPLHEPAGAVAVDTIARRTCRLLQAVGARHLVIIQGFTPDREASAGRPGATAPLDAAGRTALAEAVHRVARLASEEYGLVPCFHPHAGTYVEFQSEIDWLVSATDPELVGLCIDTGHCAYAGIDSVELYRRHADRVVYFHLKDVSRKRLDEVRERGLSFGQAVAAGVFCPLGAGIVDFAGLRAALADEGFEGWATVEQDRLSTDAAAPVDHAAASLAHLRDVGLAAPALPAAGGP